MSTRLKVAAVLAVAAVLPTVAASAAPAPVRQKETCPVPVLGIDPDFLTLSGGPTTFTADGKTHAFALTATEEEGGNNVVILRVQVGVQDSGTPSADAATTDPGNGVQVGPATSTATVNVKLQGAVNGTARSYVIEWTALFDNGIHPCSSTDGSHAAFVVTVLPKPAAKP